MAVNRPRRQLKILPVALAVTVLVIIVIVVGLVLSRGNAAPGDPSAAARASALEAANALDVFEVEYPKQTSSGAGPALSHANAAFDASKAGLAQIDSARTTQIAADLDTLNSEVTTKASSDQVSALAEKIKQALLAFSASH